MGILRKGVFDGFEGKTGPLVGRKVNGKSVISAAQHKTTKPRIQAQIDQQLKFALVTNFLKRFKRLIAVGFANVKHRNAFNAAVKYNFRNIIRGVSPDYSIDYSKLVYSRGCLAGAYSPSVTVGSDKLIISWLPHAQSQLNQHSDKASFLVYCPDKQLTVILERAVNRAALQFELELPVGLMGLPLHVYMSFVSINGKEVSNSMYLGIF
ncbi:DUF6266 family protein [Pedobacter heparinus]|uniref:DUF6266 family protein n=1 Tax=Pedobacter heparinus TaxID=984 RepID=UPI00292CF211|nr:DUF6266 family protein [Pedobacter heparinus]